jgi:hypothetical protein
MTVEMIERWTTTLVSKPLAWLIYAGWLVGAWLVRCVRLGWQRFVKSRSARAVS